MQEFTKYFENKRLGKLYFPNGKCITLNEETPFHIELSDLYKLVTGWKINHTEVPLDDIVGVITFGSAVRNPEEVSKTRKRYLFFGPEITKIKQIPIQPNNADFLVITGNITGKNLIREEIREPIFIELYDGYTSGNYVKESGIHIVNRGIEQVINGVNANDAVSALAMREGVPIFYNGRLADVQSQTGIVRENKRKISWDENKQGYLTGKIE